MSPGGGEAGVDELTGRIGSDPPRPKGAWRCPQGIGAAGQTVTEPRGPGTMREGGGP